MITRSLKALVIMCLVTLGTETHCSFTPQQKLGLAMIAGGGGVAASLNANNVTETLERLYDTCTTSNPYAPYSISLVACESIFKITLPMIPLALLDAGFSYLKGEIDFAPSIALYLGYGTTLGILVGKKLVDKYEAEFNLYQR